MDTTSLRLFACGTDRDRGERVARGVGVSLVAHEERDFEDGEHKMRPLASVRGAHAFVLSSLHGDAQRSVKWVLAHLPAGADPNVWTPSIEQLDEPIDSEAALADARADWYSNAPSKYARLLDAEEVDE